ncbi:hypothetical protein [Ruegeria lacuscaerulensis]|uniref:hypothetical protein n=1 Tax=Ruegeria lacuscaerulensis TaxID=55218 RepID=UPI00147DC584|nr:hypothetical protein [Ruegeria lacuscaerulensis]
MRYLSIILLALSATQGLSQDKNFYRLQSDDLECIVDNIGLYRAMGDLVYVDVTECPPQGEVSILDKLVNEMPNPEFSEEYDSFLVLTVPNLNCLSGVTLSEGTDAYRFYPDNCRVEAE